MKCEGSELPRPSTSENDLDPTHEHFSVCMSTPKLNIEFRRVVLKEIFMNPNKHADDLGSIRCSKNGPSGLGLGMNGGFLSRS